MFLFNVRLPEFQKQTLTASEPLDVLSTLE